jgi:hypothetical protein
MSTPLKLTVAAVLAVNTLACIDVSTLQSRATPDASDGPQSDGTGADAPHGDAGPDAAPCIPGGTKPISAECVCDAECSSGHCVDRLCCDSACTDGCKTCAGLGLGGTCVNRTVGSTPRDATACPATPVSTCGLDGKCDGMGGCSKYPVNTVCRAGTCDGDAVIGANVCDGLGQCKPGATRLCVPFSCNASTGACNTTCTSNSQCVSGIQCVVGSCGPRPKGAACQNGSDCASAFCADGVCCNVACSGACISCNLIGHEGTCWPLEADVVDTRRICVDMGPSTCGENGLCDGVGGCQRYPSDAGACLQPDGG